MRSFLKLFFLIFILCLVLPAIYLLSITNGDKIPGDFTLKDIPPASFDKTNGFYRLYTLSEAPDMDIESDEVVMKYRRLFDPQYDNDKFIKEWSKNKISEKMNKAFKKYLDKITISIKTRNYTDDFVLYLRPRMMEIEKIKKELNFLLNRYYKLIRSQKVEEFTMPNRDTRLPNMLTLLKTAYLYISIHTAEALKGNWEKAINGLIINIVFGKKMIRSSRTVITNLMGKAVINNSLFAILSLMNQKECPKEVFKQILKNMPDIMYKEYGTRIPYICEYLSICYLVENKEYLKDLGFEYNDSEFDEKWVRKYCLDYFKKLIDYEKTMPYKWKHDINYLEPEDPSSSVFWLLKNRGGKAFAYLVTPDFSACIYKAYLCKTLYDMTLISAEFHLKYTPGKSKKEILRSCKSYKTMDPCSGKPYIWNEKKGVLYSIGIDRKDNNGVYKFNSYNDSDYSISCVLH